MSEELKGRELGWDDEIEKGADYVLLPEGEYDFTIESFERGRFEGSDKAPACPRAELKVKVETSEGMCMMNESLLLYDRMQWKLAEFFLWAMAEGVIYDMFDNEKHVEDPNEFQTKLINSNRYVSSDYGTQNATVFLLWNKGTDGVWYCTREYYYSGRDKGRQKTDAEYAKDLESWLDGTEIKAVIVDPAAASFIAELRKRGFRVIKAKNDVEDGIRLVSTKLNLIKIIFSNVCQNTIKEFASYIWDAKAAERGKDKPIKQYDHAMDAVRYFVYPFYGAKGSLGTSTWFNTKFLSLKSAGQQVGRANGGLRTIILPADSTGDQEGCQNFYSYFHILFYAGLMGQTGEMCINYLTADDKLIAGVNWYKSDMSGNTGHYDLVCYNPNKKSTDQQAGRVLKTYTYMTSHLRKQNPWYWNWGHCDLRKEGSKLTFFYNGSYPSFSIPEIADMKCAKIQIAIKQRGTRSGNKYLTYNGINAFYFQKLHVEKWKDVPNKFAQDCSLIANCSDGSIRMNGLPKPDLGALGNDWETFCLKPGVNQVQCLCSSWAKKPTFKMKYREVFL